MEFLFNNGEYQPFSCPEHGSQLVLIASLKGKRPLCRECKAEMLTIAETTRSKPPEPKKPQPKKPAEDDSGLNKLERAFKRAMSEARIDRRRKLSKSRNYLEE